MDVKALWSRHTRSRPFTTPFTMWNVQCRNCGEFLPCLGAVNVGYGRHLEPWCIDCQQRSARRGNKVYDQDTGKEVPTRHTAIHCDRCAATTPVVYHITWGDLDQLWCQECALEVEQRQKAKGNVRYDRETPA